MRPACLALLLLATTTRGATTEQVKVDLTKLGAPLEYHASGFLHSIIPTDPPDSLIAPLKPKLFRLRPAGKDDAFQLYNRVTRFGAALQIVLSDSYTNYKPPFPGDNGDFSRWENHVTNIIRRASAAKMKVQWDLWNEPDNDYFWKPPPEQFLETWNRTYKLVRKLDPKSTLVGPSLSNRKTHALTLEKFLLYAKANNCLPDVLAWHQWNGNVVESVDEVKSFMKDNGIKITRISLNEIVAGAHMYNPGLLPRYFAEIERAGVESAAHACWPEENGVNNCDNASLDGLLTHDTRQPRAVWHVYAAYGRMTGKLATVTRSSTVDGLATVEPDKVAILLGRFREGTDAVEIQFTGAQTLRRDNKIHVRMERIADTGTVEMKSPAKTMDEDRPANAAIPLADFGSNDALVITLTRPK